MKCLVLGRSGQLASHLSYLLPSATFWGRESLNLAEARNISARIEELKPDTIINAAAYTAVDQAEAEPEAAWQLNAAAVAAVAGAARSLSVPLVHISTDYVFDGKKTGPYMESDATFPINVYGRTKCAGELAIESICEKFWILRASWIFSEYGMNFPKTMIRLARERDELSIVSDQRGTPTYAGDLAEMISSLIRKKADPLAYGTYHVAGGRPTNWFDFAAEILRQAKAIGLIARQPVLRDIPTVDYPTPAQRPMNSILSSNPELMRHTGVVPDWHAGLSRMLAALPKP